MTTEQLDELKRTTPREAIKKYLPMLRSGRINRAQYAWAVGQAKGIEVGGSTPAIDGAEEMAAAFGGTVID